MERDRQKEQQEELISLFPFSSSAISRSFKRDSLPSSKELINIVAEQDLHRGPGGLLTGFDLLDSCINGWQPGLVLLAGRPNVGKSAFQLNLSLRLVMNNKTALWVDFSIDDSKADRIHRLVAILSGMKVNEIIFAQSLQEKNLQDLRETTYRKLTALSPSILFFDASDSIEITKDGEEETLPGDTIEFVEEVLSSVTERYPDRFVIATIDAFHNLRIHRNPIPDPVRRTEELGKRLKVLYPRLGCLLLCSAHLRKYGQGRPERPSIDDIKESVGPAYDANLILLLHSEVQVVGEDASRIYWTKKEDPRKHPIVECQVTKNKWGYDKPLILYRFEPWTQRIFELKKEEARIVLARL